MSWKLWYEEDAGCVGSGIDSGCYHLRVGFLVGLFLLSLCQSF
jgi:hypothetical protein